MGIVRFDPFREMDRLQNEVNRLFEGYLTTPERGNSSNPLQNRVWSPSVDIMENQNEIVLRAELPGLRQEDIDIELSGDTLTLRGERKFENELRKENMVRIERSYGRFQRSFTLGVPVQQNHVSAAYRDGILEVHLPKSEENKPRKVQVTLHVNTAQVGGSNSGNGTSNADSATPQTGSTNPAGATSGTTPSEQNASVQTQPTGAGSTS